MRFFEFLLAIFLLLIFGWLICILIIISTIVFKRNGLFTQTRIGKNGRSFRILKIRSLPYDLENSYKFGRFIRSYKLDELPQIVNVLAGDMSFVGPRPEIPEYFEKHNNYPDEVLNMRPGLTGLASLYFWNEEKLLEKLNNDQIEDWIFQRKNTLNKIHYQNKSFCFDLKIIYLTVLKLLRLS